MSRLQSSPSLSRVLPSPLPIPIGPTRLLTRVLFVDGLGAPSLENGSLGDPFLTIQAAIDAIPVPNTVVESAEDWTVLITPGDYDEPLQICGPVRIALIGLGAFRLGRYTVAGGLQSNIVAVAGSTPRNVVWTYDNDQMIPGGAAPQLAIGTVAGTDVIRPGKPIANRISGSIIVQGKDWIAVQPNGTAITKGPNGGTAFLAVTNTQVDAGIVQDLAAAKKETDPNQPAIDTVGSLQPYGAFTGILVDRHFSSRFRGPIRGALDPAIATPAAYVLATSFMSQYEQIVRVSQYASIQQGAFAGGMSASQSPSLGSLKSVVPPGIANSTFAGTFTGPGALLLDATTNTWFIRNGASLAPGATKVFLGGASQAVVISAAKTLTVSDCGVTLLADGSAGSFSVTLPNAVNDLTFTIKNIGSSNSISVMPVSGEPIDGATSVALAPYGGTPSTIKIVAQDGRWWIVGKV